MYTKVRTTPHIVLIIAGMHVLLLIVESTEDESSVEFVDVNLRRRDCVKGIQLMLSSYHIMLNVMCRNHVLQVMNLHLYVMMTFLQTRRTQVEQMLEAIAPNIHCYYVCSYNCAVVLKIPA